MEYTARLIITFLFIGLIVLAVVFLGVTLLASLGHGQLLGGLKSTSTVVAVNPSLPNTTYSTSGPPLSTPIAPRANGQFVPEGSSSLPTVAGGTRHTITENIPTPGPNATNTPANVAIPTTVQQTGAIALRNFIITGTGGKFSPNTIVINQGDVINLTLVSADATYNIFFPDFGVTLTVPKGSAGSAQFQPPNYGQYQFYCKDVCASSPVGILIVNP
jgi:heme/copper-type cytochrome/quinol oxidase subunit 2